MRNPPRQRFLAACAVTWLTLLAAMRPVQAGDIFVFGDSLSDTGNLFALTNGVSGPVFTPDPSKSPRLPTPPCFEGRASNGPVWIEQFAAGWGASAPLPAALGGTNYAFIGAVTGPGSTPLSPFIPSVYGQAQLYLGAGRVAAADDLFVVWGGANDFFYGQSDWTIPVGNIVDAIELLHREAGATNFLVPNLPPLDRTPSGAIEDPDRYRILTTEFNTLLNSALDTLRSTTQGLTLYELDVHSQFVDMLTDPGSYGLTNVDRPALSVNEDPSSPLFGYPLAPFTFDFDPEESLFFDGVHPTALGHALLADAALASVPEPAAWLLFGGAVAVCVYCLRRQPAERPGT